MKIGQFKPEQHDFSNKVIALIGERGAGKSWIIKAILCIIVNIIPYISVFSGTEKATHFFEKNYFDSYIFNGPNGDAVSGILSRGTSVKETMYNARKFAVKVCRDYGVDSDLLDDIQSKIDIEQTIEADKLLLTELAGFWKILPENVKIELIPFIYVDPRSVIIYDDCLFDPSAFKEDSISELSLNGRHLGATFIFALQKAKSASAIRDNIDYIIICGLPNAKAIYEAYNIDSLMSLKDFRKLLKSVVKDHKCLVIHKTSTKELSKKIFYFKVNPDDHFRSKSAYDLIVNYHNRYYNENYNKESGSSMGNIISTSNNNDYSMNVDINWG